MPDYVSTLRSYVLEVNGDKNLLLVNGFTFTEALSQIPVIKLDLMVENKKVPVSFPGLVGANATLHMEYRDDSLDEPEKIRKFEGILRSLVQGEQGLEFTAYRAELVPKIWALSQQVACRVFRQATFGDIIQKLIAEAGATVKIAAILTRYPLRWVCQYEEPTLDFIARILEQEGVTYYFDYQDANRMVLANEANDFKDHRGLIYLEDVETWERTQGVRPTRFEVQDWNYRQARSIFGSSEAGGGEMPGIRRAAVEYPLPLEGLGHAERMAGVRLDEVRADRILIKGRSFAQTLAPGRQFQLSGHFSDNGRYLVVAVTHVASAGTDFRSGASEDQWYQNEFLCVPAGTKYRAPRVTPRPRIYGVQPAVVTNLKEDPQEAPVYCRVKVKFSWAEKDSVPIESDWLRITHPWASNQWGFQFQPRVNDEVMVAFENGDPDRAVVVGGVYNFSHRAPWPKMWQEEGGGIRSEKGNELVFVDKPGEEALKLYAKREHQLLVEKDSLTEVRGNLHETVTGDRRLQVTGNLDESVTANHREKVTGNVALSVTGQADIKSTMKYAVRSDMEVHVSGGVKVVIDAGVQISLKVGSSCVDISPAGVSIVGPLVRINSGGSGGSGSGSSPTAPQTPLKPQAPGTPGTSTTGTQQRSSPQSSPQTSPPGGSGSQPPGQDSPSSPPVVQERMSAPSFRKLLSGIASLFSSKKKDEEEKEPPGLTTGLGLPVDEMVAKSPTLTKNLETLQANGWTIEYGKAGKGSYCDRNAKKIVVDKNEKGDTLSVVQTLSHESGHAMYTPDPYVPPDGLSKEEYVSANVKRDLRDEGEATITNLQVRDELIANGEGDIGVAGAKAKEYQKAFDSCDDPDDPTKRDALRTQIGGIFEKGEHPSTDPEKTYGDYYAQPYEKHYDKVNKK